MPPVAQRNSIPVDEIAPVIGMLVKERWPNSYGYDILAEKVGCDPTAIEQLVRGIRTSADFNLIDQTLCSLGRPDLWWGIFSHIYYEADLSHDLGGDYIPKGHLRCQRVGCGQVFKPHKKAPKSGPNAPKFCSSKCTDAAFRMRKRGGYQRGAYGPGMNLRRMACHKGHDFTPENTGTRANGKRYCVECNRERQRNWIAQKRARLALGG